MLLPLIRIVMPPRIKKHYREHGFEACAHTCGHPPRNGLPAKTVFNKEGSACARHAKLEKRVHPNCDLPCPANPGRPDQRLTRTPTADEIKMAGLGQGLKKGEVGDEEEDEEDDDDDEGEEEQEGHGSKKWQHVAPQSNRFLGQNASSSRLEPPPSQGTFQPPFHPSFHSQPNYGPIHPPAPPYGLMQFQAPLEPAWNLPIPSRQSLMGPALHPYIPMHPTPGKLFQMVNSIA